MSENITDIQTFSVIGTVKNQAWIPDKNGGKPTLELQIISIYHGKNGNDYEQLIPVRCPFQGEETARHLPPGTRVNIVGNISGRGYDTQGGFKIYTSFTARAYSILPPAPQNEGQQYYQPQPGAPQQGAAMPPHPQQVPVQQGAPREIVVKDEDVPF